MALVIDEWSFVTQEIFGPKISIFVLKSYYLVFILQYFFSDVVWRPSSFSPAMEVSLLSHVDVLMIFISSNCNVYKNENIDREHQQLETAAAPHHQDQTVVATTSPW